MACMAYIKTKIYEHKRTYIYVDYMYMSATTRKHDCARRHTHNFVRIVRNWGVPASPDNKTSLPPSWNYIFIFSVFFFARVGAVAAAFCANSAFTRYMHKV